MRQACTSISSKQVVSAPKLRALQGCNPQQDMSLMDCAEYLDKIHMEEEILQRCSGLTVCRGDSWQMIS
jgi:hypothetical protein